MNVAELIEILKTFPPDAEVWAQDDEGSFDINSVFETGGLVMLDFADPKPPAQIRGTQVFIDGKLFDARGMTSTDKWMTIDADGLPKQGRHHLRVVLPDGSGIECDCNVWMIDPETGEPLGEPRFYVEGTPQIVARD